MLGTDRQSRKKGNDNEERNKSQEGTGGIMEGISNIFGVGAEKQEDNDPNKNPSSYDKRSYETRNDVNTSSRNYGSGNYNYSGGNESRIDRNVDVDYDGDDDRDTGYTKRSGSNRYNYDRSVSSTRKLVEGNEPNYGTTKGTSYGGTKGQSSTRYGSSSSSHYSSEP
jgi:hypothetical protein